MRLKKSLAKVRRNIDDASECAERILEHIRVLLASNKAHPIAKY